MATLSHAAIVVAIAIATSAECTANVFDEQFFAAKLIDCGDRTVSLDAGDFDGDGNVDLVHVGKLNGDVVVLMGRSDGTFDAPRLVRTFPGPTVQVADMDGDGALDLVVSQHSTDRAFILFGSGDGYFDREIIVRLPSTHSDWTIVVEDFDVDGVPDLLYRSDSGQALRVFLGHGDGRFREPILSQTLSGSTRVTVGDVDGDGLPDVVLVRPGSYAGIEVLLGGGDGSFASSWSANGPALGIHSTTIALGDVDLDGDTDLIVVDATTDDVAVVLQGPGGTFVPGASVHVGGTLYYVFTFDLDLDGVVDLLLPDASSGTVAILQGDGSGGFVRVEDFYAGNGPSNFLFTNLPGDDDLDLVIGCHLATELSVFRGDGTGGFHSAPMLLAANGLTDTALADVDGDGHLDLLCLSGVFKQFYVSLGDGTGGFAAATIYSAAIWFEQMEVADLDGDGNEDVLVWSPAQPFVYTFFGAGDGTFGPATSWSTAYGTVVGLCHLDGDGWLDLVYSSGTTGFGTKVRMGVGGGAFAPATSVTPQGGDEMEFGDIDGDADTDLVLRVSSTVFVVLGNGNGTAGTMASTTTGYGATEPVVADIDGDGHLDVAVAARNVDEVWIHWGTGTATMAAPTVLSVDAGPTALVAFDLDSDGKFDIVTANYLSGSMSVLRNAGARTFHPESRYAAHTPYALEAGDIDSDGLLDLITDGAGGGVIVQLNQYVPLPVLIGDVATVSLALGGTQVLELRAGTSHAGDRYMVLGSRTGVQPGVALGAFLLPLVSDAYTFLLFTQPGRGPLESSLGTLDASGRSSASWSIQPAALSPSFVGLTLYHAYFLANSTGYTGVSNPVALTLVP